MIVWSSNCVHFLRPKVRRINRGRGDISTAIKDQGNAAPVILLRQEPTELSYGTLFICEASLTGSAKMWTDE
jgi:hypothetical protein